MTSPRFDETLHYARKNWPVLSALFAGAVLWGVTYADVAALKDRQKTRDEDHDAVVRLETQVEGLKDQVADVVTEQKTLHDDIVNLRGDMNDKFNEILRELRERPASNGG